ASFFWYIPFLGVSIYAGGFLEVVRDSLGRVRRTSLEALVVLVLLLYCLNLGRSIVTPLHPLYTKESEENWFLYLYGDHRRFVEQLEAYHLVPREESTLVFVKPPLYFDRIGLRSMIRCLYHDDSIEVRVADGPSAKEPIRSDTDTFLIVYKNGRMSISK